MATQSVATVTVRPCVMTTPLGTPVVPEVKRMSDASSGPRAALRRRTSERALAVARARKVPQSTAGAVAPSESGPPVGAGGGPWATTMVLRAGRGVPAPWSMAR